MEGDDDDNSSTAAFLRRLGLECPAGDDDLKVVRFACSLLTHRCAILVGILLAVFLERSNTQVGEAEMFRLDSSAFLSFVFFRKLRECYTEEATLASYFCLFLLFCYCPPGPANLPSSCCATGLAGNDNKELRV